MAVLIETGPDAGEVWHFGNPFAEQKALLDGGSVQLAKRQPFFVEGPDRLMWLHAITSQRFEGLEPGVDVDVCVLDAQGRIRHGFTACDDGERLVCYTEPKRREALLAWLGRMIFRAKVRLAVTDDWIVVGRVVDGKPVARAMPSAKVCEPVAGLWAWEALRIAAGVPRVFVDTDDKTIPNEIDLFGTALNKGCYPGQETVGRVWTLGRPPRRLVRLHLDGSAEALPTLGAPVELDGVQVGFVGSSARHHEDGPIALALVKRQVPVDATLVVDAIAAAQEVIVNPDVGLHVRPQL